MEIGGQFGIQIPFVLKYAPRIRLSLQTSLPHVRAVIRSFGPVVISRGVVQLSGYVDQIIASWLVAHAASYRITFVSFAGRRWTPAGRSSRGSRGRCHFR